MAADYTIGPSAATDIEAALDWYANDRPGRAEKFEVALSHCIRAICAAPTAYRVRHRQYRRANLQRFPYFVTYSFDGSEVAILAVRHTSRDPNALRRELDEPDAN